LRKIGLYIVFACPKGRSLPKSLPSSNWESTFKILDADNKTFSLVGGILLSVLVLTRKKITVQSQTSFSPPIVHFLSTQTD
jgi:hypothetical protein